LFAQLSDQSADTLIRHQISTIIFDSGPELAIPIGVHPWFEMQAARAIRSPLQRPSPRTMYICTQSANSDPGAVMAECERMAFEGIVAKGND